MVDTGQEVLERERETHIVKTVLVMSHVSPDTHRVVVMQSSLSVPRSLVA